MLAFLGPLPVVAIAPFCTDCDLLNWATAHPTARDTLAADAVWQELLLTHFQAALRCLGALLVPAVEPEALVALHVRMEHPRHTYELLKRKTSVEPFTLEPQARLLLEIHELREWDRHQRQLLTLRQAGRLAELLPSGPAPEEFDALVAPVVLELVSLQAMMGGGAASRLLERSGVQRGPSVDEELRHLMEKRLQQRRSCWQRQREFLLQDLEMH